MLTESDAIGSSSRSFSAIALDNRVTVAVVTRDVLSRAVTGTDGSSCSALPRPPAAAAANLKVSNFCAKAILKKGIGSTNGAAVEIGVFAHWPPPPSSAERFIPLPVKCSEAVDAAAASVASLSACTGDSASFDSSDIDSLLGLLHRCRLSPSVADQSIRHIHYLPSSSFYISSSRPSEHSSNEPLSSLLLRFPTPGNIATNVRSHHLALPIVTFLHRLHRACSNHPSSKSIKHEENFHGAQGHQSFRELKRRVRVCCYCQRQSGRSRCWCSHNEGIITSCRSSNCRHIVQLPLFASAFHLTRC